MYEGTSTEQKAKNAKSGLDSMSKPLLQSIRQHNALLPPFTQRRLDSVYFIWRVSAHFIDSLEEIIAKYGYLFDYSFALDFP